MTARPSSFPWKPYKLDELGFVGRGRSRHRPRNDPVLYDGEIPFFQTGDVKEAELYLYHYSQTYNEMGLAQSKLWQPGTLCITIAANIAETAILAIPGCFPDSVVGFVADQEKADAKFIKYYIDTIKLGMQGISRGTTQNNLSLDKLLSFDFLVPEVEEQRRIASVLSAYDDLIENNTRRIAILEDMARALYQEWFVHFRFPGHEHVPLAPSCLGQVPEGWEVGELQDAVGLQRKFDLTIKQREAGGIPVFASTGVIGEHSEAKVRGPGVVTGRSGSLGTVMYCPKDYWPLNTTLWVKEFRRSTPLHAFYLLQSFGLEKYNGGAAVPTLNRNHVHRLPTILPSQSVLGQFDKVVSPMYDMKFLLVLRNENLRTTRDLLLPKLISGEIDVSALPKEPVAEAAD